MKADPAVWGAAAAESRRLQGARRASTRDRCVAAPARRLHCPRSLSVNGRTTTARPAATAGDHDGTPDLVWDRVPGATGHGVYRSTDVAQPAGRAFACRCSPSGVTVNGLASGTRHGFRVRAVGAAGPGPWSDPTTKIAP